MLAEPFELVDLGVFLDQTWGFTSKVVDHRQGTAAMAASSTVRGVASRHGDAVAREDFPEDIGLGWMDVHLSDHAGNHIDAPWHFGPPVEGKPAKTIDQVPLEWCVGRGVRLDSRSHLGRDIGVDDTYFQCQGGLSPQALNWILDRGVKLIGIDAYAMDVSYQSMQTARLAQSPQFFPLHFVGRAREHMHLEKLTNLGALPRATGFGFSALPNKLRGGSAGWVRPVAMVPRSHYTTDTDTDTATTDTDSAATSTVSPPEQVAR